MFGGFMEKPYFCNEVRTSVVQKKTNKLLINNKNKLIMNKPKRAIQLSMLMVI